MSNKVDYKQIANNNITGVMDSFIISEVKASDDVKKPLKTPKKEVSESKSNITIDNYKYKDKNKYISKSINGKKTKIIDNDKGKYLKDENYTITFKIDADIEDFLKNISYISFIETQTKGIDATEYVNNLIRQDMLKILKVDASEKDPNKWIDAYNKYKSKKGL